MKTLNALLFISIFSGLFISNLYAEEITFNGTISEYSCSKDSNDIECKKVVNTVDRVKASKSTLNMVNILNSADKKTANFSIQHIEKSENKIIIVNYS